MRSLFHQNGLQQRASAAECAAFDARRPRMSSLFHQNRLQQRVNAAECGAFDARRPRMSSFFHQKKLSIAHAMPGAQRLMRGGRV